MSYEALKKQLFPRLFDLLFTTMDTKISSAGAIRINSEKIDHKTFSEWFIQLCKETQFKEFSSLMLEAPTSNSFFEDFRRGLKQFQVSMKYAGLKDLDVIKDFNYDNLVPFVSIDNVNVKMFFDKESGQIYSLDYKTYELTMDKEYKKTPIRAVINFNPYRPEQIYVSESNYGKECTHINTFKRPEWQLPKELTKDERQKYCKLPERISKFMCHLFPDEVCREFVYDWLHFALTKRCETYLVLNGAKGIGKGIFTDHLCRSLIGKNNHLIAPPGGLESNFNAMLKDNRMIIFDEFRIDEEDKINKLKRYINKDQTIEHKGEDIGKTVETFNSFIISSNSLSDMRISWDDRRFSVADIVDVKLDEVWTKEEITALIEDLQDGTSTMQNFGYWLLYRNPKGNEFQVYKGKHFYKLCYSSLAEWSKVIIDEVASGESDMYDDSHIKLAYKNVNPMGRFPQPHRVEDFLKNYKHEGKYYLGDFKRDGKGWYIQVDKHFYTPMAQDSTGIQWKDIL